MKRLLVVAADRALTRFISESLLDRAIDSPPRANDPWDIARAHTPVEASVLVTHGLRPFDVIIVDHELDGPNALELLDQLRSTQAGRTLYLYLLTERGRDAHFRRRAVEHHSVTGFIDKPVTAEHLKKELDALDRDRRILLAEPDDALADRYASALESAGYVVKRVTTGRAGLEQAPRFRPDAMLSALVLPDLKGLELCVALKRTQRRDALPVILYGQATALEAQGSEENAFRADDFLQAPFDDGMLVERIMPLAGVSPHGGPHRRTPIDGKDHGGTASSSERSTLSEYPGLSPNHVEEPTDPTGPGLIADFETTESDATTDDVTTEGIDDTEENPPTPPTSASPSTEPPRRRTTRRVPCNTAMSIRNGARIYRSRTLDISRGGIFLATDEALEVGERIDMAFKLPDSPRAIRALGKVCWQGLGGTEGVTGVGVKFSRIDSGDLDAIVEYVNRVAKVLYSANE